MLVPGGTDQIQGDDAARGVSLNLVWSRSGHAARTRFIETGHQGPAAPWIGGGSGSSTDWVRAVFAVRRPDVEPVRSRKQEGKAPQAATTGPDKRGDLPRPRSPQPRAKAVNPTT